MIVKMTSLPDPDDPEGAPFHQEEVLYVFSWRHRPLSYGGPVFSARRSKALDLDKCQADETFWQYDGPVWRVEVEDE